MLNLRRGPAACSAALARGRAADPGGPALLLPPGPAAAQQGLQRSTRCGAPSAPDRSCPPGTWRHTQNSRTFFGGDAEPPVVAQHGVKVGAHLLHTQLQQLGQLPGHAERLILKGLCSTSQGSWKLRFLGPLCAGAEASPPHPGVSVLPVLSALQGAHELLLPVAQQDVVVGPLADEGLVVVGL